LPDACLIVSDEVQWTSGMSHPSICDRFESDMTRNGGYFVRSKAVNVVLED
jgi:hypothetical protein